MLKIKLFLIGLCFACLLIPHYAVAVPVYETTGWIEDDTNAKLFDFVADTAPFTYKATLSDLSEAPSFGFDDLYLSMTTGTDFVDSIVGPGSFTFEAISGEKYFATVIGTPGGEMKAGLFGILVETVSQPVPEPATMLLLGSGLLGLAAFRRKFRKS